MARKNILSDVVFSALRKKQEIRALRTTAREEIRAIKKAGGRFEDLQALEKLVKNNDWLLSKGSQKDVRRALRTMAQIDVTDNITFNYQDYIQAKENIRNFNLGSDVYNAQHATDIANKSVKKSPYKKWTIGKKDTQESANEWLQGVLTKYSSRERFFEEERQMYIDNLMKSLDTNLVAFSMSLQDDTKAFIRSMLQKYVKTHGAKHLDIESMYEPQAVIQTLDDMAMAFDYADEWKEYANANGIKTDLR